MAKGDIVVAPDGERIELVDVGQQVLLDNEVIRVWDVSLDPGGIQPWHLHHNPYVVLSLEASPGRMDWLDGSEPRFLEEYVGGAVYRPVSPVHRLTNIGDAHYRNRLVEFKHLGELRSAPYDIGPGVRSIAGERPGPAQADGRLAVMAHEHTQVWEITVEPGETRSVGLADVPHVIARIEAPAQADDPTGAVAYHAGGALELANADDSTDRWFVVELTYLKRLDDFEEEETG